MFFPAVDFPSSLSQSVLSLSSICQLPLSQLNSCRQDPCYPTLFLVVSQQRRLHVHSVPSGELFWLHYRKRPVVLSHGFQCKHREMPLCMKRSTFFHSCCSHFVQQLVQITGMNHLQEAETTKSPLQNKSRKKFFASSNCLK